MNAQNGELLKVKEVSRMLRFGQAAVYELCRQKGFPNIKIGNSIRIPRWGLDDWMRAQASRNV